VRRGLGSPPIEIEGCTIPGDDIVSMVELEGMSWLAQIQTLIVGSSSSSE